MLGTFLFKYVHNCQLLIKFCLRTTAAAAVDNRNQTVEAPQPDYEPLSDDDNDLDMMLKGTDDGRENKETKMRK